jgi:predicted nucleic acid-binding protein
LIQVISVAPRTSHCWPLIAAHAHAIGATIVTANADEFKRVRGLKVENWLA